MNVDSFELLKDLIIEKSQQMVSEFSEIIEYELKSICDQYGVPPDKLIIQYYPEGNYSISVKVSEFKIEYKFINKQETE